MKKLLTIFSCLMAAFVLLYSQKINANANSLKSSLSEQTVLKTSGSVTKSSSEPKMVLMHYMGWYGNGISAEHWNDGQPRKPLIGYYNSHSWATQMYQILLSWSCGIDGLVINVKDTFDTQSLKMLTPTLKRIRDIDSINFDYKFAVSYDDQGMVNMDTAKSRFTFLKESILPNNPSYLRYKDTAVVFIYNYNAPPYLGAKDYKTVLDKVFTSDRPKVFWNEIDTAAKVVANSFYSWVKADPVWEKDGSNWGKKYLYWYDSTIVFNSSSYPKLNFATLGVWAGFNDTVCSWGKHRWINRHEGAIYDSTWNFIKIYNSLSSNPPLPLKWVYIETWNDWNEGSEIEPSIEYGYKYLDSTINKIKEFKGENSRNDTSRFEVAQKIYEAANLIETKKRDSASCYPCFKKAVKYFILNQCDSAILKANKIIDSENKCGIGSNRIELNHGVIEIYPNPSYDKLYIRQHNNQPYTILLTDIQGKVILSLKGEKQLVTIDVSQFPKGLYLVRIKQNDRLIEKKIVVP